VTRVILGTVALRDPGLVKQAAGAHPGGVVVGIDARGGKVAVEGWAEASEVEAVDLARRFEDAGVAAIVYTDIERDGALQGINLEQTLALAEAVAIPVIASGGLSGIEDIKKLKALEARGISGAICGRALYDGRLDPAEALAVAKGAGAQERETA
jgi:phosphoribosylformimino-5-aminoimidazole carboxamide ribotide isomerase